MKDSEKEKTKLLATMMNTIGTNVIVVGLVVPFVAILYDTPNAPAAVKLVPAGLAWFIVGSVLHLVGRLILKGLDP